MSTDLISKSDLEEKVGKIEEETDTTMSVAITDGDEMRAVGHIGQFPAWSTIKVPIALAAVEECSYDDAYRDELITASIEWSDNDAAYYLWTCLGDPETADARTEEMISRGGTSLHMEPAFGLTRWSIPSQAQFGHYISSLDEGNPVIEAMHNIDEEQSYGLGTLDDAAFKGGWSDDEDGSWHTRQFGFFNHDGETYGVAIAARSESGSYADGQEALTAITEFLIQ
ncbi:hypothetical protein QP027_00025 [Corynebacterium breve]|uniref:Beta-lactamase n=1 Tax=Corynebacterium breve TaxID=3049799 RepID=A0ABY8VDT7_9CORY|nr:hypothetical protein [Corynebacterium breve]WIM67831.1 hypothetical protein QP027_00025 [Corynebacterium breve]